MRTLIPKPGQIQKNWLVYDAEGKVLGRLAAEIAKRIRGKYSPLFTPHMDTGDNVVVVNAEKISLTGRKAQAKSYFHHTGYPTGAKDVSLRKTLQRKPEWVVQHAVRGMLPKNRLGSKLLKKLHVYAGPDHPHKSQKPITAELK